MGQIEARIDRVETQLQAISQQLPVRFPSARHLASHIGLAPREYSSGLSRYLGRVSKRGDGYLRKLLIYAPAPSCYALEPLSPTSPRQTPVS